MTNIKIDDINLTYIIDSGNFSFKIGSMNENKPRPFIKSIIGINDETNKIYFNNEINDLNCKNFVNLMNNGEITDLQAMEKFWHSLFFNELKCENLVDKPILYTFHMNSSKFNKENIVCNFFEIFNIPYFYLANQALMNIYSIGRISGVIFNVGGYNTSLSPIFEGSCNIHSFSNDLLGGEDLTFKLEKIIEKKKEHYLENLNYVRDIKENFVKISNNSNKDILNNKNQSNTITLPDGKTLDLGDWTYTLSESLFDRNDKNIISIFEDCFNKIELEYKKELYNNIILTGGCSNFNNFDNRLLEEINKTKPEFYNAKIINANDKINSSWVGGSILANLSNFQQMWVSKQEYEDSGPTIVHRKCL